MRPAWLSLLFVVSFALAGEDGLPDVEAELLEYARKHSSRREWPKAERAYLKVLQSFAESKQAPRVHYELGRLHFRYARRWATAAKWYDQTIAKYPETEWGWKARWGRAETYARMQQIDQAVTLFRMLSNKAPDEKMRSQAAARILSVQNKYFALSVRQSFTVGQAPWVQVQSRGIGNAHMRLESVPYEDVLERIGPQNQNLTAAARASKRRALVKEWNIAFPWMKGRWRNQKAALPALDAGVYLVTARTEGLSFHVVVLVNSFGIVTKAAPDELLVFAQSRRDGTPLAGTDVRVVTSEGTEQMRTASDGLVAMSAVTQGALVVARPDNENSVAPVWRGRARAQESRR
ncbi:MAG: tetratricopeptide repeat protein [Planctomycetota bacterium]